MCLLSPLQAAIEAHKGGSFGSSKQSQLETDRVLNTLVKVGNMLKAALGEAGLGIIMANLRDSRAQFDPMIPGKRIYAAFGFCDIRDFTTITECLGESVMSFVNTIAAIVHEATMDTKGAPNKNIGDAFLCVWKARRGALGGSIMVAGALAA